MSDEPNPWRPPAPPQAPPGQPSTAPPPASAPPRDASQPPPPTGPPAPPSGPPSGAEQLSAGRAFAGLGIFIVLVAIEAAIVAAIDPEIESVGARLGLQTLLAATMIGVAVALVRPGVAIAESLRATGLRRPRPPFFWVSVAAYFAYIACAFVIAILLEPEQEDVTRELGADDGTLGTVAAGLLIIGAAPIAEEIFFRGFLFAGLRRSANFVVAALVSSAIWGFFHFTGSDSWGVVAQLAVFGVILCWLYERTDSIWPTIAVHALNNAIAFTVLINT